MKNIICRKVIPGSTSRLTIVDHHESYGRHILAKAAQGKKIEKCLDLGCGDGADLTTISKIHPEAELFGLDFGVWNQAKLKALKINPISVNLEADALPLRGQHADRVLHVVHRSRPSSVMATQRAV